MLIRLRGCAGWSSSLLFAHAIDRFSHDEAHIIYQSFYYSQTGQQRLFVCNLVMDGWVSVLCPFNSISVISRQWKGEHERLCAMKHRLGSGRILPPAGFEPATPWSEVGSANRSATRPLLQFSQIYILFPDPMISKACNQHMKSVSK